MKAPRSLYRHSGIMLLRATTCDPDLKLPAWPAGVLDSDAESWSHWLADLWDITEFRDAVTISTPDLARQLGQILNVEGPTARQLHRIVLSVAAYLLRWQGRATPFGLFAGVALSRIDPDGSVRWSDRQSIQTSPDAHWLAAVIDRLDHDPALLEQLPVMVNNASFLRGDRIVTPGQPSSIAPNELAPLEVSVRATGPVRAAMAKTRRPIRYSDLVVGLSAEFPTATEARIRALLGELLASHVLLTSLWPPMTSTDPLGHVLVQLEGAGSGELPSVLAIERELRSVHAELAPRRHSAIDPRLPERMKAVADTAGQPLVVTSGLDIDIAVPGTVLREAEIAATTLVRLTPFPFGQPAWKAYHARFLDRFGVGAVVPLRNLVQDAGLGVPAGYLGSGRKQGPAPFTPRDETLLGLVQTAIMAGNDEIELTEATIASLTVGDTAEMLIPPATELSFQIHAESTEHIKRGDFQIAVIAAPRTSSSMIGRFAGLLAPSDRDQLAKTLASRPTATPDAVLAQLSFPPRGRRSENVIRVPELLPRLISLSEHRAPADDLISLDDLAVTADARQIRLVSQSTGQTVEPVVLHALEASVQTPPLARFLAEIATARSAVYGPFNWGAAGQLPYLPQLRHGRTILSAARWLVTATDLPAATVAATVWDEAFAAWRHRFGVPSAVVMCHSDLRLPIDLDQPVHRELLRARLDRGGRIELREAPTVNDHGWCGGRPHELVVQLHADPPPPNRSTPERSVRAVPIDAGHLPGRSSWLAVHVHGHQDRQDEILTDHLSKLFDDWDSGPPMWWFRRYRDLAKPEADRYLRLYISTPGPGQHSQAAARLNGWANRLRASGLVPHIDLTTYHPETGRYGFGAAMAAAEAVFAADSIAAVAQIHTSIRSNVERQALTVAGLVDLTISFDGSMAGGMRRLIDELPHEHVTLDQRLRDTAMSLADPSDDWAALRSIPGGERVLDTWRQRRAALTEYRHQLTAAKDAPPVLRSLLHMHHVRTLGVDPKQETIGRRLTRSVALRWAATS
ncbi:lantibiotic dehydratase [Kribbella albertanoniae]|uniref:lantibiotic dehydratase n=1 Tax=Kribbella albertanoniae TaxID=1266829 RepID=UPI00192D48E7|nr:lantibiotic dehydratase [Kribbella albertanoniae]